MSIPLGTRVEPYTYSSPSTRLLFKPLHEVEGGGCWADVFLPKRSQPGGGLEQPERGWPVGESPNPFLLSFPDPSLPSREGVFFR